MDAIIWSVRHHTSSRRNPQMHGWIQITEDQNASKVSVKVPISNAPFNDPAIVGKFFFRKLKYFIESLEQLISKNIRVNGEFYVDSLMQELIELGY